MSVRTSAWPAGVPCWTDLTVPDVQRAIEFYRDVLGWQFADPDPEYGGYAIAQVRGHPVAGVGPQMQFGVPATWTLYLASDDLHATAKAIADHGGTMLLPPGDVGPLGRLLVAADPSGAVFGCWQAGQHIGAGLVNEPGGLAWEDLRSADPEPALAFYQAVFGYRLEPLEMAGPDYRLFHLPSGPSAQAPLGGMGGLMGGEGPSHWLVYFAVADADAAVTAAEEAGGQVTSAATETPFGRMAGLADPAGARFTIIQTDPARGQDPQR